MSVRTGNLPVDITFVPHLRPRQRGYALINEVMYLFSYSIARYLLVFLWNEDRDVSVSILRIKIGIIVKVIVANVNSLDALKAAQIDFAAHTQYTVT